MAEESALEPATPQASPPRSHDLDALRGFAMVLGIGLHAALSFIPDFWPARDETASFEGPYDEILHAIHGFRMPLFFLLSGFLTAMLWRRRGLPSLLSHRVRRIALPLAIGMVTIIPAVNAASNWAIDNQVADYLESSSDIWTAVAFGEERAVEALLDRGVHVNARSSDHQQTPLHLAAVFDEADIARLLIDRGADPDVRAPDGTPMEFAVYFGSEDVAEVLVANGVSDPRAGGDWEDIPIWNEGAGLLRDLESDQELGVRSWLSSFHHLWFLWFLLWLVGGFGLIAALADRFGKDREQPAAWTGWVMWALIPLTLLPQLAMGEGGANPTFGPDTSTGLLPIPHVLAYYAVFFAFGSLLYGRRRGEKGLLVDAIGGWWIIMLPIAVFVVFPQAMRFTFDVFDRSWRLASIAQVAYTWAMIVGLMAAFRMLLDKERRGVRYLSDSSYWLYLAHLPLIVVLQSVIRHWNLSSGAKFIGLTLVVTAFLLISYQWFVRYTPIGTLLNGKRTRPGTATSTGNE